MARGYAGETTSHALTSMEICQEIMECNKALATAYTAAALESADPSIRRTFRQMGRDCERLAYRAFEILHAQGHYNVKGASPSEVREVEDMLDSFMRGHAVPNAQEPRSAQNTWQRAGGPETERTFADRPYASERPYGNDRPYGADRPYGGFAGERGYERAMGPDRPATTGATSYGSERTSSYGSIRSERQDLPDWARARS